MDYNKLTNLLYFKVFAMNLAGIVYALQQEKRLKMG